jgi:hypothetical protein
MTFKQWTSYDIANFYVTCCMLWYGSNSLINSKLSILIKSGQRDLRHIGLLSYNNLDKKLYDNCLVSLHGHDWKK